MTLRDHPRLCGEKQTYLCDVIINLGSPPPMRGKVYWLFISRQRYGITPAYAGKSARSWPYRNTGRDHPRLCGEKDASAEDKCGNVGSPPPMRGKDDRFNADSDHERITPAYAGKSDQYVKHVLHQQDHPRLCGEKHSAMPTCSGASGSSPPMWGKVFTKKILTRR